MTKKEKVREILKRLYKLWPNPETALEFKNPWELLVATMLSAQTTDKQVNKISPLLFKKLPTPKSFSDASMDEINSLIRSVNYHNTKARRIHDAAEIIVHKFNEKVPETMDELLTLPGVARKTANVVLGNAFGKPVGIAVDTHVMRLSRQLGLTNENNPVKIESDLKEIVPKKDWTSWTHLLINYGREYSPASKHCKDTKILGDLCG